LSIARDWLPDVLATDILMPGSDGLELLAEFKALHPIVARVAMTGGDKKDVIAAQRHGAHEVVSKPIQPAELAARIELAYARHRPQDPVGATGPMRVFIGSSMEGLNVAKAIQQELEGVCEATVWSQGAFGLMEGTLESLYAQLDSNDFAVLVLSADDWIESR